MTRAEIALEFLRVILTGPVLYTGAVLYFIISQRTAITGLIDRITRANFFGNEFHAPKYDSELPKISSKQAKEPISEPPTSSLEEDFNEYILGDLETNRKILYNLVDPIWNKSAGALFNRDITSAPERLSKLETMGRIDKKAAEDFKSIEDILAKKTASRKDITQAYIKSKLLVDYFRSLATRR